MNRLKTRRDRDVLQHKKTQENVERVSEMIRSNRRVTIKEIFEDLNISYGSVVRRKRPKKWANGFILHHDNAPCHILLLVRHFLSNKNITVCPYPPYSPDLAPCDFWLFPKVKMTMKGKRFESIQDIKQPRQGNQRNSRKRTSRTALESGKNDGINVLEARGVF